MMYHRNSTAIAVSLILLFALLLASCTGSGDGSGSTLGGVSLSSLVVADKVNVVESQSGMSIGGKPAGSQPTGIKGLLIGFLSSDLPATSEYMNDPTSVYVNERSMQSFQQVNNILCLVKQTRYDSMVNKGPYIALVDENTCSTDRGSADQSSSNQDSGATPKYEAWTVDSSRKSASSPQIVRIWFHMSEHMPDNSTFEMTLQVRVVITESVYTAPPYGIFKIDYMAFLGNDPSKVIFRGFLAAERDTATNKVLLKYATEEETSFSTFKFIRVEKATLDKSPDGISGGGTVMNTESETGRPPKTDHFSLAYDADNFYRKNIDNSELCFDRKRYALSAWRYGLYDPLTGGRINRTSGFTITKNGQYGYIGYWGYWLPNGMTLDSGDTVYRQDYGANAQVPFTVFKVDGKLKRHTKKSLKLDQISNIPMDWYDSAAMKNTRVIWDKNHLPLPALMKVAEFTTDPNDSSKSYWANITPVAVSLSGLNQTELYMWSQSLGGSVRIKLNCGTTYPYTCTASGTTDVVYYIEDIVYPNDPAFQDLTTLACFWNCPDATALTTNSPFKAISTTTTPISKLPSNLIPGTDYTEYTFDRAANVLKDGANNITTTSPGTNYQWGIRSGELFEPTAANLDLLACNGGTSTCGWQAGSVLDVFYTWETGTTWSQFTALVDGSGTIVNFEPPLQVIYTHVQTDPLMPDSKYNGITFYLGYESFGNLQGIPSGCVNLDTGLEANCADASTNSSIQWVPEFFIPAKQADNVTLTEVFINDGTNTPLLVKPLEMEERMLLATTVPPTPDPTICSNKFTVTDYQLPSMIDWDDPAIGQMPSVSSKPKVIAGELN